MSIVKEAPIFVTTNVDLASYLMLVDIKFLEFEVTDKTKKIVAMRFLDEKRNCLDLERVFFNSEFKKYRDINKYLLSKIHEKIREDC